MSGTVCAAAKALTMACDALSAIDSVNKMYQMRERGEDNLLETASAINRFVLLGFTCVEAGMLLHGSRPEGLALLKQLELMPRIANIPIQLALETSSADRSVKGVVRVMAKGVLAPFADACRVSCEGEGYQAQAYLEQSKADPAAQRPVYEWIPGRGRDDSGYMKLVGFRPIDSAECEIDTKNASRSAVIATTIRTIANMEVQGRPVSVHARLARFFGRTDESDTQEQAEWENLLGLSRIPLPLHEDAVFRRYVCPITNEPIRDPVRDPDGHTLYERTAIYNWLGADGRTSPMTRRLLSIQDLQEVPAVRALIDTRLQQYQEGLIRFLEGAADLPIDPLANDRAAREYTVI